MNHEELVEKINGFTKLAKERELTPEEAQEREALRKEYVQRVRNNLRTSLEGIEPKK
ncbi:MAG TPA: DUF896 domain-containing protein [Clostridiaceae bacterium]|nr:DUF896 domain-containing protein [Clostridiaceae bacterium]